ncbi:MAG: hypothetical protein FJ290_33470 [Planctomycetes bacterium]|nr:hypothetical protein [Planctomycetota bacterium]
MGTGRGEIARRARQQVVAEAYGTYAVLVLEHERLRRTRWRGELGAAWPPDPAAWSTLRFLASVHDAASHSTQVLLEFFGEYGGKAEEEESRTRTIGARVPWQPWREALRAGIDLVGDVLALHGAELPWGRGKPRVPRKREEFEAICGFLRDLPAEEGRPPLSDLVEAARLPALPHRERPPGHRVTFYRARQVLSVDGVRIALPMGRELEFLDLLAQRRRDGEVTPPNEHGTDWRHAVDNLRRRIRRMTGDNLMHCVVLSARGPVGGYRLAAGVRVRDD